MKAERVVLDTNVLIGAALRRDGRPRAVVDAMREERGVLLFCDETFDELRTRLRLPKFDRRHPPADRSATREGERGTSMRRRVEPLSTRWCLSAAPA